MPNDFVETPEGLLLIASGFDKVLRWNGFEDQASEAGVLPPEDAVTVGGSGAGSIIGTYKAYLRFVDEEGNFSNLSPISEEFDAVNLDGQVIDVRYWSVSSIVANFSLISPGGTLSVGNGDLYRTTDLTPYTETPIQIRTENDHGLSTGTVVRLSNVRTSSGLSVINLNDRFEIKVDGPKTFRLVGLTEPGARIQTFNNQCSGTWEAAVSSIDYTNVAVPQQPRVARRQILRNTDGQFTTFYVDVDTTDLTSTSFSSTNTDETLEGLESQALLTDEGFPLANAYTVPPDYKAFLGYHLGRAFLAGEVEYREGNVSVTFGSTSVVGIGTEWTDVLPGRFLHVQGARKAHEIDSVDLDTQTITLTEPYSGATAGYADYAIRPAPAERNNVYFSESGLPEAWPPFNAFSLPEDGDQITGLMAKGSFLYVLKRRHIYRFTAQSNPAVDGFVFKASDRGCVNHRCYVVVEDSAYMLDEQGVHRFGDGREPEQLSQPITDLFDGSNETFRVNWRASRYFHAAHFKSAETIKWFVALSGSYTPRHALCLDYRSGRWWIEEYPFPIGASCLGRLNDLPQVYLGSEARRVFAADQGWLDGADDSRGQVRGTATSSGLLSLTDTAASFDTSNLQGVPVVIVEGKGRGQIRTVVSATATKLTISEPWLNLPDSTSVYQVGGIPWRWRSGWFRYTNQREQDSPRRLEVVFKPLSEDAIMDLRIRRDRQPDPVPWEFQVNRDDNNGVGCEAGADEITADLTKNTGFVQQRLDHHREWYTDGPRFISWEMAGVQNIEQVEVFQLTLDGTEQ